jgi:hypothetical protein
MRGIKVVTAWRNRSIRVDFVPSHSFQALFKTGELFEVDDEKSFINRVNMYTQGNQHNETTFIDNTEEDIVAIDFIGLTIYNHTQHDITRFSLAEAAYDCAAYHEADDASSQSGLTPYSSFINVVRQAFNEPWIYSGDKALKFIGDAESLIHQLRNYDSYIELCSQLKGDDLHIRLKNDFFAIKSAKDGSIPKWLIINN